MSGYGDAPAASAVGSEENSSHRPNPALGLAMMAAAGAGAARATTASTGTPSSALDFRRPGSHDNHPFFSYYGLLVHQQNMMQDSIRTSAYQTAITENAPDFAGKTVLDVGTGSGILAVFAARAGAARVYAVEASGVADRAAKLIAANGLADVITVIRARIEEVVLPPAGGPSAAAGEPPGVDIIISEPMGFMLVHERMLESYMIARQRFLRPGGRMFPSTGTIFAAPYSDATLWQEQVTKAAFWQSTDYYGLDITCLADAAADDHFAQPVVGYVDATSLLSTARATRVIDFERDEPESLHDMTMELDFPVDKTGLCHGLALWFDVLFDGTSVKHVLSTAPTEPATHWYQCRLVLREPLAVNARQRIRGSLRMQANASYSYDLTLSMGIAGVTTETGEPITSVGRYNLQQQQYRY